MSTLHLGQARTEGTFYFGSLMTLFGQFCSWSFTLSWMEQLLLPQYLSLLELSQVPLQFQQKNCFLFNFTQLGH